MSAHQSERNVRIFEDVAEGRSMSDVAREHGITPSRVRQIVQKELRRRRMPTTPSATRLTNH